nr:DUF1501 domain-containing protein [Pseudomonadales bacterium]
MDPLKSPPVLRSNSCSRRSILQAGTLGLLGLDMSSLQKLSAQDANGGSQDGSAKSVLFIFLSGGLSQLDSFDMKPLAPAEIRGEFSPRATPVPGIQVCEHLPRIGAQMKKLAMVRSLTHFSNEHNEAHTLMLTGRSVLPPGYQEKKPQPTDWPSITATVGRLMPSRSAS